MHINDTYAMQMLLEKLAEGRVTEVFQQQKMIKALLEAVNEDIKAFEKRKFGVNDLFVSSVNGVFNKKDFREWFLSEEIFTKEKEYRYPDKAFDKI